MFSKRTSWDLTESSYAKAVREVRAKGGIRADLTQSNPTRCGFVFNEAAVLSPLSDRGAMSYDPDPRGMHSARSAVAGYYAAKGIAVDPAHVQLTTSTSEGYSYLFRLLCDAGDEVMVPQPSYPLFDFLAGLDDVRLVSYPLFEDHGWHMDLAALEARISDRTRAIMLVHPNNPTGHFTSATERQALESLCVRRELALIVDEVFLDYPLEGDANSFVSGEHQALTFVLSGLSKVAALPQMKVGWIVTCGPQTDREDALARLEVVADTFLSMNAPAQMALPHWLAGSHAIQSQIIARVKGNLAEMDRTLEICPAVKRLPVDSGWSVVLRIPALEHDEAVAESLVRDEGVVVHPGSFYGFPSSGWLVISLLPEPEEFSFGLASLLVRFAD